MKLVIDTNIIAYYILKTEPYYKDVSKLFSKRIDFIAPESWKAEFVNVIWLAIRNKNIALDDGIKRLMYADGLIKESYPISTLWSRALILAEEKNHSPYDTLFIALAEKEKTKIVTIDKKLINKFPQIAVSPKKLLKK